ncbi:MAG TPA: ABC transporter permease subunit [Candidatus Limnocylindrales bacterium]|nr:ABC transporter permease subunit [Candidatus Limnocylindrales bacterium]
MTSDVQRPQAGITPSPIPLIRRIYGFGTIFAKTIRDSRRATLLVGGILGLILIGVSRAIISEFSTAESREQIVNLVNAMPPILQGLAGRPVNVDTLGGYISYKYGTFFPLVASLWSILALSGTLAGEARRGSLEFVAATPLTRRRIALQKLAGHIVVVVIAVAVIFVSIVVAGSFATLPGDEITVAAAAGYSIWLGLLALVAGSVAFAVAPFLGRGAAIGIAGALTFAGFILNGYQFAIPELAPFANLTWFGWTTNHLPLAGEYDWPSVALVGLAAVVLFAVGIEAFVRRDIGITTPVPTPSLPRALVGLRGPAGRTIGNNLPTALAWGLGLGIYGLLLAASAGSFVQQLGASPDFERLLGSIFPGIDMDTVGGFLQLLFIQFGLVLAGLAAATLVGGWASDETSGRLELLLASPLARARWVVAGGLGILVGIAVFIAISMLGIAIGAASVGGDVPTPVLGTLALGLFAITMAGVGIAVGGLVRSGIAAPVVAVLTIATWFVAIIGPALKLPDVVQDLALSAHYGLPMVGRWDAAGIVASLVLAIGGVAIGAWGFARRDLSG